VNASATRPTSVVGALAVSTAAQVVAKVVHLALNLVASLALIRYLQPAGYGDYVFVLTIASLFALLSDLGLSKIAVRESSRDESATPAILGTVIAGKLMLAAVAAVLVQITLAVLGSRAEIRIAVGVASLLYVTEAFLSIAVVFQLRLRMEYEAAIAVFVQAVDTALILVLIASGAGLALLVGAPVVSGAVGCVLAFAIARRKFGTRIELDLRRLPHLLIESAPIGVTLVFAIAYLKLDSVMLAVLATSTDVGLYGSAFRPIEYLLLASGILITPMFPLLARWYAVEQARFAFVYWRATDTLIAVFLPVPVLLLWSARPIVAGVFGESFAPAAIAMQILGLALVLMIVSAWQSFALLAAGRQRLTVLYDAAALVLNVSLNLVLIPRLGFVAAAITALGTSAFVLLCSTAVVRRVIDVSATAPRILRIVAANAALALVTGAAAAVLPWWTVVVLAPVPYAAFVLAFRVTTIDELRAFLPARSAAPSVTLADGRA